MKLPIYLDYAATTPVDERVLEEMLPYFNQNFGNSASRYHAFGWLADDAVQVSMERISKAINCKNSDIIFTSGATEAINLAIKGFFEANPDKTHFITVYTEHKATLDTLKNIKKKGIKTSVIGVNSEGEINIDELEKAICPETGLISLLWVNNETGVIHPLEKIVAIAKMNKIVVHVDGTQAIGKVAVNFQNLGIDLLSFSAHKFYGPKGIGVLIRNKEVKIESQIVGGGHQKNLRSGTLNIPGIVGLGKAIEISIENIENEQIRINKISNYFENELLMHFPFCRINAPNVSKVPHIQNVCFNGYDGQELLNRFSNLAISNGSACNSASTFPSHVLTAMGLSDADAFSSLRFSFGKFTSSEEISKCLEHLEIKTKF